MRQLERLRAKPRRRRGEQPRALPPLPPLRPLIRHLSYEGSCQVCKGHGEQRHQHPIFLLRGGEPGKVLRFHEHQLMLSLELLCVYISRCFTTT